MGPVIQGDLNGSYAMLIDLRCHTKAAKRGDGQKRNVDAASFVSKVSRAGVGIVAITNHNAFDFDDRVKNVGVRVTPWRPFYEERLCLGIWNHHNRS